MEMLSTIIIVFILPVSLAKPQWQSDTDNLIIQEYDIQVTKQDILIARNTTEPQLITKVATEVEEEASVRATSDDDNLTENPSKAVVDEEDLTLAIHVSSTSTVIKTYIREQWSLNDLLSNSLTFGNSPIGANAQIKIIVSMLLLLGILIFIMFGFYKLFIRYCYKPVFVIDYV